MPNNARQLVDSLQSGTPRQFGFVRPSAPWQVTLGGAERCSLAYKLAAQPSATLNLVPALQAAGHDLGAAVNRWVCVVLCCVHPGRRLREQC